MTVELKNKFIPNLDVKQDPWVTVHQLSGDVQALGQEFPESHIIGMRSGPAGEELTFVFVNTEAKYVF